MYLKIEGTGGGASGSGISHTLFYDKDGILIPLTKADVVESNATSRTSDAEYLHMLQGTGTAPPYNGNPSLIYYIIKLPDRVEGFSKVSIKNWGNSSYNIANVSISSSEDNVSYEVIHSAAYAVGEAKEILQDFSFHINRLLFQSGAKAYSLKHVDETHPTKMTSNTAPAPFVASASNMYSATYSPWTAFDGANTSSTANWRTAAGIIESWIALDFGEETLVNNVTISSRNVTDYATSAPKKFRIEGSFDGADWRHIATFSDVVWSAPQGSSKYFEFRNNVSYRHYRIYVLESSGQNYVAIGEILFGCKVQIMTELEDASESNFIEYGETKVTNLDPISIKRYVMGNTLSKELNRKPNSILIN